MAFLFLKLQPNAAASAAHKVLRVESNDTSATAWVNSYATAEMLLSANPMLNWQQDFSIPLSALADPQAWLIGPEGPFPGATVLADSTPLEAAKVAKWAEIKQRRDELETGGFPYMGKVLDSDQRSVLRMFVAERGAASALAAGAPYANTWTCKDDSELDLDAEAMVGMPLALAQYGQHLFVTARDLRGQIEAAESVEAVRAISWPSVVLR